MIIMIDAGHGIETAGKRSPDGSYLEYEFNRDVAGRIRRHLARCGIDARLTCPDEHDLSLSERCRISNAAGADGPGDTPRRTGQKEPRRGGARVNTLDDATSYASRTWTRCLTPLVNSTVPAVRANSVSSLPMPTLSPGWM